MVLVGCPTAGAEIVSPASVKESRTVNSAPDDHFAAGQHCRVTRSGSGRVGGAGGCPTVGAGIVSPASVQKDGTSHSPRPRRSFHCRSTLPCDAYRAAGALVVLVAVQLSVLGLYLPPVFRSLASISAPDDHFAAGPHCRVIASGRGRVGGACGCPTVGAGIVSSAGVQGPGDTVSAPDDHFAAGPHCRVIQSARGRVGRAGGCPTIRAGIVSPAGVKTEPIWISSTPDDHFAAGPNCRVENSGLGRVGRAGCSPRVIGTATRRTSY